MEKENIRTVNWVTTFQLPNELVHLRDKLEIFLNENEIQSRKFFAPMKDQPFLSDFDGVISGDLSISTMIANSGLYLPTYIGITDEEINFICEKIELFFEDKV